MKKFMCFVLLVFLSVETLCGRVIIEFVAYYPEEMRSSFDYLRNTELRKEAPVRYMNILKSGGYPTIELIEPGSYKALVEWIYVGDFCIEDYYPEGIKNNLVPGMLPIPYNRMTKVIRRDWNAFLDVVGVSYVVEGDSVKTTVDYEKLSQITKTDKKVKKILDAIDE